MVLAITYINKLSEKIEILNKVSKLNDGVEMVIIPEWRRDYLILNSAGLIILGRIGNILFKEKKDIDTFVDLLAKIDWRKDAEMWKLNIVQPGSNGDKIATSNSTLKEAVRKVMMAIGLDPKENTPKKVDTKKDPRQAGLF